MNIQVVSEFYYPDNFRINDIVSELVSRGNQVRVLTALPDYETGEIPAEYRKFKKRREVIFGAETVRIHTTERRKGALRRTLNYSSFMVNSFFYALFCRKPDCDAILNYMTSPIFQALPAVVFKWRTRKKLVMYCCDLWPESMKAWGVGEDSFLFKRVRSFSGWLYRRCDVVAITSEPFRAYLQTVCGVEPQKIVYLPQHCNDDFAEIASVYEENGCTDFLFAGNVGAVQNVNCIIRAAARIETDKRFRVHIVGDGTELSNMKALAEKLKVTDKVIFHGRHPGSEMTGFYKMADCFLLTLRQGDSIGLTLPGKVQGYLCAGKPIAAAIDGAGAAVIRESDCGGAVRGGDYAGLAGLMLQVMENPGLYREKGRNGRKYYETHYTKERFMERLLQILESEER